MNKAMIFTVTMPSNNKPIIYAQSACDADFGNKSRCEQLLRDWLRNGTDEFQLSDADISETADHLSKFAYAYWDDTLCFELTEVYG